MINRKIEKGLAEKVLESIEKNKEVKENYYFYLKYIRRHFKEYNIRIESNIINSYAIYKLKEIRNENKNYGNE